MWTRREWLEAVGLAAGSIATLGSRAAAQTPAVAELVLTNGKFVDGRGVVGSTVSIRNGRIESVGDSAPAAPGVRTIDLGGRTVVPGLFDAHVHYLRAATNPGHDARRIERAFTIAELQEAIARRAASAPAGEFITCIGGWNHTQLAENRRPTKAELDAAAPKHGVYISGTGGGTGAITNTVGQAFFKARGVAVEDTGVVPMANAALTALQAAQTPEQKLRGVVEMNAHANSLGLTGVINSGNLADEEHVERLRREGRLTVRIRMLLGADGAGDVGARAITDGNDLLRVAGFGERIGGMDTMSPAFEPVAREIARIGGMLHQHSINLKENDFHLAAFEAIAKEHPIDRLRWALIHLQSIDEPRLKRLMALGAGASAQTWTYFGNGGGPPFRRIVDSGIRAGVGTDSTNVSALDPWVSLFYMTTGRNVAGVLTNDGQQVSRTEALRLYTEGAAWFSFDDHHLGAIAEGTYADLAVLSQDYLTVPEAAIRKIESVMTFVGGRIVYSQLPEVAK